MRKTVSFRWHSQFGLAIGFFILIAALSGSCIAFYHTLDAKVNPWQISHAPTLDTLPSDPLSHIEQVEFLVEGGKVSWVSLVLSQQGSWHYFLFPKTMTKPISNSEVFVDPYSGDVKGMRFWGDITQGMTNLLPFIYKLHYSLSLGSIGEFIMGLAALSWFVVLMTGIWITLPKKDGAFFREWKKNWKWRFKGDFRSKNYFLHKTAGLWLLPLLMLIAWSSFALNLHEFHERLLSSLLRFQTTHEHIKELKRPRLSPKLSWIEAREKGREYMKELAHQEGFDILEESSMMYDTLKGVYTYSVKSSRDVQQDYGTTSVYLDGNSGALKASYIPTGKASGNTLNEWLTGLHKGSIWGLPHRITVAILGIVCALFALSGFYLWWKRRATLLKM